MKTRFLSIVILLLSVESFSQKAIENNNYKLENKTLIAKIGENDKINFSVDKSILLNTINELINVNFKSFDEINILSGNHPKENFKYYYLELKSKTSNRTFVKWLINRDNELYYEDSENDKYSSLNFFVICEGNENCYPRMYFDGNKYAWICGEVPMCVTEEEARKNPCKRTSGIF